MAKRKDSLALFEVFGQKPSPASDAASQSPGQQAQAPQAPQQPSQPVPPQPQVPVAKEVPALPVTDVEPAQDPGAWRNFVTTQGKTVQFSLQQIHLIVAGSGLVILLIAVFFAGRLSASKEVPPGPIVPQTAGTGSMEGTNAVATAVDNAEKVGPRTIGKYYLVIQGIPGKTPEHYQDAQAIVAFLKENQVPASVHELRESYIVWSEDPMDKADDKAALDYARKIEDLGKKYKDKAEGKYNFSQKGSRDGKPWYILQTRPQTKTR